ncbi:DMT family transporter [Caldithrix abyssi]|uniref:EamA domain-containing membrane protein RarD n=1 Tax=Caldithrix abyssi DSM 13497 TaxID=880073 RepID=H1XR62_CALAY|nr:DMT family transporter [Caldithrix abyssi]APF17064.1 EamA domain-containing membrane protein RarD [Caldithrix abyssi DSM 13497]EHO41213.1 protein of unknown function DUF6 transmembrane [Caldithrix abyssi DSM 13497]
MTRLKADLGLLSVTVFWGTTFIVSKLLLSEMSLAVYMFYRMAVAALAMTLIALKFKKAWNKQVLRHGLILGVLLYASYFFQMWGITQTSASNAGFITGLSVVLVPVLGFLFYKEETPLQVWGSVILAVTGLLLLSGANPFKWSVGDLKVLICAIIFAFHIIYTGRFSRVNNVYLLTAVQLVAIAAFSFLAFLPEVQTLSTISLKNVILLIYLALFGTVFTFLMQTSMQRFTTVARTAIIFSMEPVFAALFAFLIAGEKLTAEGWLGGLFIVLAMVNAEFPYQSLRRQKQKS